MEKIITDAKNNGDYNEGIVDCSGESMKLLSKEVLWRELGSHPIVTFQYSSTTLYRFSYHIR